MPSSCPPEKVGGPRAHVRRGARRPPAPGRAAALRPGIPSSPVLPCAREREWSRMYTSRAQSLPSSALEGRGGPAGCSRHSRRGCGVGLYAWRERGWFAAAPAPPPRPRAAGHGDGDRSGRFDPVAVGLRARSRARPCHVAVHAACRTVFRDANRARCCLRRAPPNPACCLPARPASQGNARGVGSARPSLLGGVGNEALGFTRWEAGGQTQRAGGGGGAFRRRTVTPRRLAVAGVTHALARVYHQGSALHPVWCGGVAWGGAARGLAPARAPPTRSPLFVGCLVVVSGTPLPHVAAPATRRPVTRPCMAVAELGRCWMVPFVVALVLGPGRSKTSRGRGKHFQVHVRAAAAPRSLDGGRGQGDGSSPAPVLNGCALPGWRKRRRWLGQAPRFPDLRCWWPNVVT